jgi:hypothetical protein
MNTDIPDCPDCLKLMVEDLAKSVADPRSLAKLQADNPQKAQETWEYLAKLLGRPNDSLEQLARLLARRAKARVGLFEN